MLSQPAGLQDDRDAALPGPGDTLFEPGRNCYAVAEADRAALLVDAEAYFRTFAAAAEQARHSIVILGWDFNSRTRLRHDAPPRAPEELGDFLNFLVRRRRGLEVYILDWDYPMVFGADREFPPLYGLGWKPARRVHLRYDNTHPVGGSQHQKIVVMDDALAFSGGLDLTWRRWDTCEHRADDPRRMAGGEPYPPFHDLMVMVDGEAARSLARIARQRWERATGRRIPWRDVAADPWPRDVQPDLHDVVVGISRTQPQTELQPEVREIEALYLDMVQRARHCIYIENQYFTAHRLGEALAARLREPDGPEVVVVSRLLSHGWLEEATMHVLRARLLDMLRAADRWGRFGAYYPHVPGLREGTCVDVHSKLMIVDEEWLRIGSANFCNRSMGMDTECDVTIEARGRRDVRQVIRTFRADLLGEHLDCTAEEIENRLRHGHRLNEVIRQLMRDERTLKPLEAVPASDTVLTLAQIADPERPVSLDRLIDEFSPTLEVQRTTPIWRKAALLVLVIAALTAAWRYTPLAELVNAENVAAFAAEVSGRGWVPIVLVLAYLPASLILFPRPLLTLFAVVAFGAWQGCLYALTGVMLASLAAYWAGRLLKRDTVRRLAGAKLNRVSEVLRHRGLLAMIMLRLVPVAPFIVVSTVAGAIRIRLWHYALGTLIGMLPGTLTTTIFGDQIQTALADPGRINYWLVGGVLLVFGTLILCTRRWLFQHPLSRQHGHVSAPDGAR